MNNYSVYKHTTPNGKVYIGLTNQKPEARWQREGLGYKKAGIFRYAIAKYGWENIEHTILATGLSEEMATIAEKKLIKRYRATDRRFGYNLQSGGNVGYVGKKHSEEYRKKMSEIHKGALNPMYGEPLSEEHRRKIAAANTGRKFSAEVRKHMSEAQSHRSEETIARLRAAQKKKPVLCVELDVVYESVSEACREFELSPSNLTACCKGRKKTVGGFHWQYV